MNTKPPPTPLLRGLYLIIAALFFVFAVINIVVPGLPTTPLLLLTSYFLVRSSPALNQRLLDSRMFGPILKDWQREGIVRRHIKARAIAVVVIAVSLSAWLTRTRPVLLIPILIGAAIGVTVIYRLPSDRKS